MDKIQQYFTNELNEPSAEKREIVQSLWSNYGEIVRYFLPICQTTVIVKHICPPANQQHPRGWDTPRSHQRKLRSYQVESQFYRDYALRCDNHCKVPKCLGRFNDTSTQFVVLEDLDQSGFHLRLTHANLQQIGSVIRWLAYFHGLFMHQPAPSLWQNGTYWHLQTRPDELAAMENSALKMAAAQIDQRLYGASHQTLLHGDAKLANFCFSRQNAISAVDFQYVGKGIGVVDLAYFLGSCLTGPQLEKYGDELLNYYFECLSSALKHYGNDTVFTDIEELWRGLYCFAWADFERFLRGWSPEHIKINDYMTRQSELALAQL